MPLPFTARSIDPDAAAFCARSGASDRAALSAFVRGVKDLGLWESMVCWPLRSTQNAGTGTTVHSLGGYQILGGSAVGGPAWAPDGMIFDSNAEAITLSNLSLASGAFSSFSVLKTDISNSNSHVTGLFTYTPSNPATGFGMAVFGPTGNHVTRFIGLTTVTTGARSKGSANTPNVGAGFYFVVGGVSALDDPENATGFTQLTKSGANTRNTTLYGDAVLPYTFTGSNYSLFGSSSSSRNEQAAFQAWFVGHELSAGQVSDLQTLYRATLGTGLGLP